jgi:hypothetical protein
VICLSGDSSEVVRWTLMLTLPLRAGIHSSPEAEKRSSSLALKSVTVQSQPFCLVLGIMLVYAMGLCRTISYQDHAEPVNRCIRSLMDVESCAMIGNEQGERTRLQGDNVDVQPLEQRKQLAAPSAC